VLGRESEVMALASQKGGAKAALPNFERTIIMKFST
jgi:hypothetical protein